MLFNCSISEAFGSQYYYFGVFDKKTRKRIMPGLPFNFEEHNGTYSLYGTSNGFMFNLAQGEYWVMFQRNWLFCMTHTT